MSSEGRGHSPWGEMEDETKGEYEDQGDFSVSGVLINNIVNEENVSIETKEGKDDGYRSEGLRTYCGL